MTTCTRPGCRKKATYDLTLTRADRPTPIQQWHLCADHRDAVQFAISDPAWGTRISATTVAVPPSEPAGYGQQDVGTPRQSTGAAEAQAALDKEDGELRDQVARSAPSFEGPEDATVAEPSLATRRGRPVARPTPRDEDMRSG